MVVMMAAVSKPDADPELVVKIHNAILPVAQAVPKERDPLANLPVFNITFVNGRMSASVVPGLEFVTDLRSFVPTSPMLAQAHINAEVIREFEEQP